MALLKITKSKVEIISHELPVIGRLRPTEGDTF